MLAVDGNEQIDFNHAFTCHTAPIGSYCVVSKMGIENEAQDAAIRVSRRREMKSTSDLKEQYKLDQLCKQ